MTKTDRISESRSAITVHEDVGATSAAAQAAIVAAKEAGARARQRMIELREEVRLTSKHTHTAVAATKELLDQARSPTAGRP
jgi:hypothetical protein